MNADTITDKLLFQAGVVCERERILAILRAVSPNAGYDCKLLLAELITAIEGNPVDADDVVWGEHDAAVTVTESKDGLVISETDAVRDFENRYPHGRPRRR